ncbi:fibronectin type III domain-containing protein, partial [bacterium]|nr:fibronectin type III domain-containing protein [bacterium]
GIESAPDRILVTTIMDQQTTFYDDEGLEESTTYYYQLLTFDTGGLSASSNEVSGIVNANEEPEPVTLVITSAQLSPDDSTTAQIELKWTQNNEQDFDHYVVYRDLSSPVSTSSTPVDLINDSQTTTTIDSPLSLSTQYFYRVYVFDEDGLSSGSNEVDITTPSNP